MEDGLNAADALDEDLAIRSTYETAVMDLTVAHHGIADAERYFDPTAPRQPTWRVMADLPLRREGAAHPTRQDRRQYRALKLGRSGGDALLAELMPYPHPKASGWLYQGFGRYRTWEDYMAAMSPERMQLLRDVLAEVPREIIVCDGKTQWARYQELFENVTWRDVGPCRVGEATANRVILTTRFSDRAFNTDEQLAGLANLALRCGHESFPAARRRDDSLANKSPS